MRLAWRAAAGIARNLRYPCSATLVEHSLNKKDYIERNGLMAQRIRNEAVYNNFIRSGQKEGSIAFNDNRDLFYALHLVSIKNYNNKPLIHDRFNFNLDPSFKGFARLVNNGAYLSQNMHVLNDIGVYIYMY